MKMLIDSEKLEEKAVKNKDISLARLASCLVPPLEEEIDQGAEQIEKFARDLGYESGVLARKLSIATEALEKIANYKKEMPIDILHYARTALEKIKEEEYKPHVISKKLGDKCFNCGKYYQNCFGDKGCSPSKPGMTYFPPVVEGFPIKPEECKHDPELYCAVCGTSLWDEMMDTLAVMFERASRVGQDDTYWAEKTESFLKSKLLGYLERIERKGKDTITAPGFFDRDNGYNDCANEVNSIIKSIRESL